jgi:hypothetical protein
MSSLWTSCYFDDLPMVIWNGLYEFQIISVGVFDFMVLSYLMNVDSLYSSGWWFQMYWINYMCVLSA